MYAAGGPKSEQATIGLSLRQYVRQAKRSPHTLMRPHAHSPQPTVTQRMPSFASSGTVRRTISFVHIFT